MSCDITPDLAAYQTAVETETHGSSVRTALTDVWHAYTTNSYLALVRSE